jgi:hypothetical protein
MLVRFSMLVYICKCLPSIRRAEKSKRAGEWSECRAVKNLDTDKTVADDA